MVIVMHLRDGEIERSLTMAVHHELYGFRDSDGPEGEFDARRDEVRGLLDKWRAPHGNILVEFDLEKMTARVLELGT